MVKYFFVLEEKELYLLQTLAVVFVICFQCYSVHGLYLSLFLAHILSQILILMISLYMSLKKGKVDYPTGWSKLGSEHYTVDSGSMLVLNSRAVSNKMFIALIWQFIKISLNKMR